MLLLKQHPDCEQEVFVEDGVPELDQHVNGQYQGVGRDDERLEC
jgi:hypothetical protein